MDTQKVIFVLNQLPTRYPSEKTAERAKIKIQSTAEFIAPLLAERGLQISKGGISPSSKRSYARIYLEKTGNVTHNSRHAAYAENVVDYWEKQVASKYGAAPLTCKSIFDVCNWLISQLT